MGQTHTPHPSAPVRPPAHPPPWTLRPPPTRIPAGLTGLAQVLLPIAQRNKQRGQARAAYATAAGFGGGYDAFADAAFGAGGGSGSRSAADRRGDDWMESVEDLREYDVPYHHRIAIDTGRRVGLWCGGGGRWHALRGGGRGGRAR